MDGVRFWRVAVKDLPRWSVLLVVGVMPLAAQEPPDYEADVLPILEANCFICHGPAQQRSGLRLDRRDDALRGGNSQTPAIVAGQPDSSRLIKVLTGDDTLSMPPAGDKLTEEQIATLRAWIAAGAEYPAMVDFATQIQPILAAKCQSCHGPEVQESSFRVDQIDSLMTGGASGATSILPHKPAESDLLTRVASRRPEQRMPPAGPRLSRDEVTLIRRWIQQGAPVPDQGQQRVESDHWAFGPRTRPEPPEVARAEWVRNPIDRFVLARLEAEGLAPSPEADRRTLVRRLYLDLLGLPPRPEEVDAFLADESPEATDKLVDRLLASPHFGERWARYWLDLARYADSDGYEKDTPRPFAWRWRDWVIDAINRDLPYDQFTIEQLAGDLLPEATQEQLVATGFHRNTLTNREGGVDPEQYRVEQIIDRTNTTGTVWLGLTLACAQCHTHKYDPITQTEYYRFFAFFNDADERDITAPTPAELAAYNEASRDFRAAHEALESEVATLVADYERDELPARQAAWEADPAGWEPAWTPLMPVELASMRGGTELGRRDDGAFITGAAKPERDTYEIITDPGPGAIGAVRLELLADDSLPARGPGRAGNGNLVLSEFELAVLPAEGEPRPVAIASATADHSQDGYSIAASIDGNRGTGWALLPQIGQDHTALYTLAEPLMLAAGERLRVRIVQEYGTAHTLGLFRLAFGAEGDWRPCGEAATASVGGASFTVQPDGAVLVSGANPETDIYYVTAKVELPRVTGIRLEALPDDSLGNGGPGRVAHGNFVVTELAVTAQYGAGEAKPLALRHATSNHDQDKYPIVEAIDGDRSDVRNNGWAIMPHAGQRHRAAFEVTEPAVGEGPVTLRFQIDQLWGGQHTLGKFRLSVTGDDYPVDIRELTPELRLALEQPRAERAAEQQAAVDAYYRAQDPYLAEQQRRVESHLAEGPPAPNTMAQAFAQRADARDTRLMIRGDFMRPGPAVKPATLAVLPPLEPRGERADRLDLARWLTEPENPLTSRVEVNRIWAHLFGAGLVRTPNDWGTRGEPPTHPELLDWLADEFIARGWSRKELIRLIVGSATYRQTSATRPELLELDPENRLVARQGRYRLQAEVLRDVGLASSGLLNDAVGGPSIRPPLPAGMTMLSYANGMNWSETTGPDKYRRGLYIFFQRTVPYPMLMTFDAPDSNTACPRRERSNTPLQALTMLNDPVIFECAQALGRDVAELPGTRDERFAALFERTVARPPTERERQLTGELYDRMLAACADEERAKAIAGAEVPGERLAETAAWVATARVLLNTDEFVTRE